MLAAVGREPASSPLWILLAAVHVTKEKIKVSCYTGPHETHYHLNLMTHILVLLHCFIPGVKHRGGGITFTSTSVHHETKTQMQVATVQNFPSLRHGCNPTNAFFFFNTQNILINIQAPWVLLMIFVLD